MDNLVRVDSNFREISDLLLFSERQDVDLSKFSSLIEQNPFNLLYFLDSFKKACNIFWQNNENVWSFRFNFLFKNLNEDNIQKIELFLEKRMIALLLNKSDICIQYNIEYLQFVEFLKAKTRADDDLSTFKNKFIGLLPNIKIKKIIYVVNSLIPFVFKDMQDFFELVSFSITDSENHFKLLLDLEKRGIPFDRQPVIKIINELLLDRAHTNANARAFFFLLKDPQVLSSFKKTYSSQHYKKILSLISECHFYTLEENHLVNFKNLIVLDSSLSDEVANIYVKKIFNRIISHKRSNADRIIRLLKSFPEISSKKILAYLAAHNQMSDIRYMTKVFPELKKLAIFV